MAQVSMSIDLVAHADEVWSVVGDFAALERWHPAVERSDVTGAGVGAVRDLFLAGGGVLRERLEALDDTGRQLEYSIVEGPLPVQNYVSILRVSDGGDGSTVEWSSRFEPSGASEAAAIEVIREIYESGFGDLARMFGSGSQSG